MTGPCPRRGCKGLDEIRGLVGSSLPTTEANITVAGGTERIEPGARADGDAPRAEASGATSCNPTSRSNRQSAHHAASLPLKLVVSRTGPVLGRLLHTSSLRGAGRREGDFDQPGLKSSGGTRLVVRGTTEDMEHDAYPVELLARPGVWGRRVPRRTDRR